MKNLILLSLLLAGGTVAVAQPVQTLYYENGKKYLEGHFTFTRRNLLPAYQGIEPRVNDRQLPHPQPGSYAPKDVLLQMKETGHYQILLNPAGYLNLQPVGLVTYWLWEGENYTQITYKDGVPNGPFTEYYAPGKVLQSGLMLNGMANGPWTYYYKNGKPFYTGTYKAYSQAEMQLLWQEEYNSFRQGPAGELNRGGPYDPEMYASNAISSQLPFQKMLLTGMQKDGAFTFYQPNGSTWAQMEFKADVPTGTWQLWAEGKEKPSLKLEWAGGKIRRLTDSTGTYTNIVAYTAQKREAEFAKMRDPIGVEAGIVSRRGGSGIVEAPVPVSPLIFTYVEQMPEFKGDVKEWLSKNMRFPPADPNEGTEGRVIVKFIVQPDGRLTNATIDKGLRLDFDAEALRLINAMPAWNAGKQNGKPVPVYYRLGVKFKLP